MVPAVVYGAGKDSVKVSISHNELLKKLNNEAFLNSILTITVDDKEESVLIKDIQVHPARRQVMHLDLQRVRSDIAIKVSPGSRFHHPSVKLFSSHFPGFL